MSRARVTLLSLIKKENKTKDFCESNTMQKYQICSLTDKDDMSKVVAFEMLKAAQVICNAVKRWLFKKWRKLRIYVVDIYFEADHDIAENVYISGDFTFPKWSKKIPMNYSFFHRSFMAQVKIHDNSQFKFIVDGTFICCPKYPMIYSPDKFTNNVFKISKSRHYPESRSFSEFKCCEIGFTRRSERLHRQKNSNFLNLISNHSFKDSNLLNEFNNFKLSYFSPDVNIRRRDLNHFEKCIPICEFPHNFCKKNVTKGDCTSTLNSTSKLSELDPSKSCLFEARSLNFSKNPKKISHIVAQQSSKTPMSLICNPLRANVVKNENNSQRDEFSDLSDDDHFFIEDYFKCNTITTEDKIYLTNPQGLICTNFKFQKEEKDNFCFVSNGFKISKNKRPSGDSFFTSRLGLGVADGVGGWHAYGIDSSEFSEKLMDACKHICIQKEDRLDKIAKDTLKSQIELSDNDLNSQGCEIDNSKYSDISKAFGVSIRKRKLKRKRSSFHLDEKAMNDQNEPLKQSNCEFASPQSDSTCRDKEKNMKAVSLEPGCILKDAYKKVDVYGSSTACVATINNQMLKIANLGDSRCMLIRYSFINNKSQVLLKTEEQQHSFNAPYQLANIPEDLSNSKAGSKNERSNVKFLKDKVADSIHYQCKVKEGDIVLLATDGLFDNLYISDILQIIDSFMTECYECKSFCSSDSLKTSSNTPDSMYKKSNSLSKSNAKRLAKRLVNEAHRKSKSHGCQTPFGEKINSSNMKRDGEILRWKGGKPDDICAVIGFIQCSNSFDA